MIEFKKTKAAILEELNKPLAIREIDLPKKLYRGQVLVKMNILVFVVHKLEKFKALKAKTTLPHLLA